MHITLDTTKEAAAAIVEKARSDYGGDVARVIDNGARDGRFRFAGRSRLDALAAAAS